MTGGRTMAAKRDYYDVLGISRSADKSTIKRAYRKLAKKYHPDTNAGNPDAEKKFKEVTEAYSVLSDPEKKKMYDQFGHAAFDQSAGGSYQGSGFGNGFQGFKSGPGGYQEYHFTGNADDIFGDMFKDIFHGSSSKSTDGFGGHGFHRSSFYDDGSGFSGFGGFGGQGMSMDDIFSMFGDIFGGHGGFGGFSSGFGGGGQSRQRKFRGSDLRVKVKLNLKEISTGVEKKFKLKKYVECSHCHGTGAEGDGGTETCPTCHGTGSVTRTQQSIFGMMQTQSVCPQCGGEGKIIKNKCKECGGEGIVYGEEVVTVKIPAGVAEGMQVTMNGKGNAGKHNGVPGDLLVLIEEEKHPELIRDESDLIYNLLLSVPTAALGGTVEIPTIDGKAKIKIEPGTQPGKVLRLRGKGLPNINSYGYSTGTGDLLVNVSVYIPETLNKEERQALEKWQGSESFKPNMSLKEKIFKKFRSLFD